MEDAKQTEKPIENVQEAEPASKDGVQVQDSAPQVAESAPATIPEVKHNETSEAPAASATKTEEASHKNYPGGERFDPTSLPKSEDAKEIRKQVEFYFSDSNLMTDKFLYTMVSENEGWAELRTVANFKRMRRFQPFTAVVEALRESTELDVDESGEKIKRKTELKPFTAANGPVSRSIYVKGFPEETKTLQIDIEKYFETFGEIKVVRLRRTDDGLFKGSVFVEFSTLEEQEAFLKKGGGEAESKLKFEDSELEVMSKKAYLDMKEAQYGGKFPSGNGKKSFNAFAKDNQKGGRGNGVNRDRNAGRGRGRGRGSARDRGGRDGDRNSERREEAQRGEKRPFEESTDATKQAAPKAAKTEEPASKTEAST